MRGEKGGAASEPAPMAWASPCQRREVGSAMPDLPEARARAELMDGLVLRIDRVAGARAGLRPQRLDAMRSRACVVAGRKMDGPASFIADESKRRPRGVAGPI